MKKKRTFSQLFQQLKQHEEKAAQLKELYDGLYQHSYNYYRKTDKELKEMGLNCDDVEVLDKAIGIYERLYNVEYNEAQRLFKHLLSCK